jgi:hypothetical protein
MNSSVISATNPQIFRAHCPRIRSTSASLTTGIVCPDIIYRTYCRLGFLSGSPTMISGLETVTNAPVSMVVRHGFSCFRPSATSLSSVPLASTLRMKRGGEGGDGGCLLLASELWVSCGHCLHCLRKWLSFLHRQHSDRPSRRRCDYVGGVSPRTLSCSFNFVLNDTPFSSYVGSYIPLCFLISSHCSRINCSVASIMNPASDTNF